MMSGNTNGFDPQTPVPRLYLDHTSPPFPDAAALGLVSRHDSVNSRKALPGSVGLWPPLDV